MAYYIPVNQDHVVDPEDFLDRSQDRQRLARLLREGRNLLVYGPRRIGKTALIKRLERDLEEEMVFLRRDCYFFTDAQDFANAIFDAVNSSGISRWKRFRQTAMDAVRGLRIGIEFRGDAVVPHIQLATPPEHALEDSLKFLSRIVRDSRKPVVLSLDEFQQVLEWDDNSVAMLRSYTQQEPNLRVVLTGSRPSIILALTRAKNPYWKQLTEYPVGPVAVNEFADEYEARYGLRVTAEARDLLREELGKYTMELVQVLDIARRRLGSADADAVRRAVELAIDDNLARYERILHHEVDTPLRRRILLALAKHQPDRPMAQDFVQRHRLGAASSVQKALQRFQELEILDDERQFLDPLFRRYLAQNAP